jgi:hypothetical protein
MGPYKAITDQNTVEDSKLEHVEPLSPPAKDWLKLAEIQKLSTGYVMHS